MHAHHLVDDVAYPVKAVADNGTRRLPRHQTRDTDTGIALGSTVLGTCGETIGTLTEVYLDNQTGQSDWATVSVGRHRCVIPLSHARVDGDTVWVPVTAEQVDTAPHHDPAAALSVEDKYDLNRHFGITDRQRRSARSIPPEPYATGEAVRTAARQAQASHVRNRDRRQNRSHTRTAAPRLCPPDALRC